MDYIRPLDGLRMIAIAAVLVFHLDKDYLTGGFVGVDLFFVISGYIISVNIWNQYENSKFSFLNFYYKRVMRLLPALLLVVFISLLLASFLYSDGDMIKYANSDFSAAISFSNIYFFLQYEFFQDSIQSNIFLHT